MIGGIQNKTVFKNTTGLKLSWNDMLRARKRIVKNGGLKTTPIKIDNSYKDKIDRLIEQKELLIAK